jgi:hypothetical protein
MDWLKWPHLPEMEMRQAHTHYSALLASNASTITKTRASAFGEWWSQRTVQLLDQLFHTTKN